MICFGSVPAGSVLPVYFSTFGKVDGDSITMTGLAITDVEIYKGISMTQRASDAGVVLLDTDGIDVDGITGIHGFSIDTGDNTDAGFYAVGSFFTVVVASVTVDGETVNFVAATFRLVAAESIAGKPKVDVDALFGVAQSLIDLKDFADDGYDPATAKVQGVLVTDSVISVTSVASVGEVTGFIGGIGPGGIAASSFAAGAIVSGTFGADTGLRTVRSDTAQAGAAGTVTLDAAASATNNFYVGLLVYLTGGTGSGQVRRVTAYNGTSKVATITPNWATNPASDSTFALLSNSGLVTGFSTDAQDELFTQAALSLVAIHLDHLLAVDYDPASKPGVATALLNELIGSDAGVSQFTANALELAPDNAGSGAFPITVTVNDGAAVLQNVTVGIYDGATLSASGTTNISGQVTFSLDAATYTVALVKNGYTFTTASRTVTGNQTGTLTTALSMTASSIAAPSSPANCTVAGFIKDLQGNALPGAVLKARLVPAIANRPITANGNVVAFSSDEAVADANGLVSLELIRTDEFDEDGCTYTFKCEDAQMKKQNIKLEAATLDISTL